MSWSYRIPLRCRLLGHVFGDATFGRDSRQEWHAFICCQRERCDKKLAIGLEVRGRQAKAEKVWRRIQAETIQELRKDDHV